MNKEEISKKIEECKANIIKLKKEVEEEPDVNIRLSKINEMIKLADHINELDTIRNNIIIDEFKKESKAYRNYIIDKIIELTMK